LAPFGQGVVCVHAPRVQLSCWHYRFTQVPDWPLPPKPPMLMLPPPPNVPADPADDPPLPLRPELPGASTAAHPSDDM